MNAETLRAVMLDRISIDLARVMLPHYTAAMLAANCTTTNRAAMFGAQVGHESASLRYMEELASGAAYEGREDLGNTEPGDGRRFKGRGPIQLTGRHNYGLFGAWCHARGLVPDPAYFLRNPLEVATPRWGFLAAAWYWVIARPKINRLCDRGDLEGVTRQVNGGLNGVEDRRSRWTHCLRLGDQLLPGPAPAPAPSVIARRVRSEDDMRDRFAAGPYTEGRFTGPFGGRSQTTEQAWVTVSCCGTAQVKIWCQRAGGGDKKIGMPIGREADGTADWNIRAGDRPWLAIPADTDWVEYQVLNATRAGDIRIDELPRAR